MAGKKLLVADDSLTIQKVIRLALSNEGYEIQAVSDGNDAAQQISLFRPDVVLIDVSLPGKTAFEVKQIVNDQPDTRDVRFVLMSSAFEKVDEDQAAQVRFDGRLTKPFDPAHLRQVLTDVLTRTGTQDTGAPSFAPAPDDAANESEKTGNTVFINASSLPLDEPEQSPDTLLPDDHTAELPTLPPSAEGDASDDLPFAASVNDPFANLSPPPIPGKPAAATRQAPPPPAEPARDADSDIKHLTESTIRMSGLDDFQWSVNEGARKDPPAVAATAAPTAPAVDDGEHDFRFDEPSLRPGTQMADSGGSTFRFDDSLEAAHEPTYEIERHGPETAFAEAPSADPGIAPPAYSALDAQAVEDLVKAQVQKTLEGTLERLAQKILPEVAERVIKQEIHKLLNSPP
jgi:CheY-like chemotaxis protein